MTFDGYILVIEDDVDTRNLLAEHLRRSYPDVREVSDGAEALVFLLREPTPAVIISDIVMPGVLGTSIAEYLHAVPNLQDVPIAFVTGSPHLAPAGYTVIGKPASLRKIDEFVRAHVPVS